MCNLFDIKKKWKTIFKIEYKHYENTIISFEFMNIWTTCQKLINNAFKKHLNIFVIAYFNDRFVYFKNINKHVQYVNTMFQCLNKWNSLIKSKKCNFHETKMKFLNFKIKRRKIKINLNKTKTIKNWKKFNIVTKILTFFKFTNYNHKFIKWYLHKTLSLIRLMQKNKYEIKMTK